MLCSSFDRSVRRFTRRCLWVMLSLSPLACSPPSSLSKEMTSYLSSLEELQEVMRSEEGSFRVISRQTIERAALGVRLPSRKDRRFTLPDPPSLNIREFLGLPDCPLTRLIAYRNGPLGRVMLPSQRLAYDHRFLREAARCTLEGKVAESLTKAVKYKRDQWTKTQWNAIWGGQDLARFFSLAWPRGYRVRDIDTSDEATFTWLATLSPKTEGELSGQLESHLKHLPQYVGGMILSKSAILNKLLEETADALRELIQIPQPSDKGDNRRSQICTAILKTTTHLGGLQSELSHTYQSLSSLQRALTPLYTIHITSPSMRMDTFLDMWVHSGDRSVVQRFKSSSQENVKLLLSLKAKHQCREPS